METIADIVAEMRAKTAKSKDEAWYDAKKWAELCNRIEMAALHQRVKDMDEAYNKGYGEAEFNADMKVGNAAKMREALVQCELFLGNVSRHGHPTLNPGDKCTACSGADELRGMVACALSAPPRNCDLYNTLDEARNAFLKNYEPDGTNYSATKFIFWLFNEAEEVNDEHKQDESLDTLLKAINLAFIYGCLPKDSKPAKTLRNCDRYANRKEAFAEWVFYNSRQKIGVIRWVDFVDWLFAEAKGATDEQG